MARKSFLDPWPHSRPSLKIVSKQQLEFQCGWITVGIVFNAVGAVFMDKVGRKPLMLFGVGGCCVCLIIEAAIVATYAEEATNKAALAAGVAMSVPPFPSINHGI
jgi:MFS family permease